MHWWTQILKELEENFKSRLLDRPDMMVGVQSRLSYSFRDPKLLSKALIHSSAIRYGRLDQHLPDWLPETDSNERMEFLGDAVLDLVISKHLFSLSKNASEGDLSKQRAHLVCEGALAAKGAALGLNHVLVVGPSEFRDQLHNKDSVLADAFEAVMAAIFIDGGYEAVEGVVKKLFAGDFNSSISQDLDHKTALQEWLQARFKEVPEYLTETCLGEAHEPEFEVSVNFRGQTLGVGIGKSKKESLTKGSQNCVSEIEKRTNCDYGEKL